MDSMGKNESHHTVVVAGYGTKVSGNKSYEHYIDQVADFVSNEDNAVDSVVFTGSYSDSKDISEAGAMNNYFNTQVDTAELMTRGVHVYQEKCAIVSWQNISYSQELLAKAGTTPTEVTIFGDVNREDKLKTFAIYKFNLGDGLPNDPAELLSKSLNVANITYKGFDFGSNADTEEERNARFAAEILGAYDTRVGNEILSKRLTEWSSTYGYDVGDNLVAKGCTQFKGL